MGQGKGQPRRPLTFGLMLYFKIKAPQPFSPFKNKQAVSRKWPLTALFSSCRRAGVWSELG